MSKQNDDGGPAFPVGSDLPQASNICDGGYGGMSLRDWFAGQAMQAIVSAYVETQRNDEEMRDTSTSFREMLIDKNAVTGCNDGAAEVAEDAYAIADAMLKARDSNGG